MPRTRIATVAGAAVLAAALVPVSAGAAQAAPPPVQVHYSDVFDILLPDPADPQGSFCGGLVNVGLHGVVDGYFSIKYEGNSTTPYFADRYRSTLIYTNPDTHLAYTVVRVRQSKDLHIVDNGDGTLTLTGLHTGSLWAYGPDGQLLDRRTGMSRETFLVDTLGTADPFDDVFTPVGEPFTAGRDTTDNFCDDFLAATSG